MMTFILCSALALGAGEAKTPADAAKPETKRLVADIDRETSAAMRLEARAKTIQERGSATAQLCALHREIVGDARFETLDQMKELRTKIWGRLIKIRGDLKRQLAKEGKPQLDDAQALAAQYASSSLAGSMSLADFATGSPASYFGRGGGAVQEEYNNAQQLIELIQRTIDPDTWDVNGGPGTMFYYAQLHCLVVRATSEVHDNVGGIIGALRE